MATITEPRSTATVAKVVEITGESPVGFEDAIARAIAKAAETVHEIRSAWIEGQQVKVEEGKVVAYRVDLKVTFVLD
jgi:flavin-binding protein dodecin